MAAPLSVPGRDILGFAVTHPAYSGENATSDVYPKGAEGRKGGGGGGGAGSLGDSEVYGDLVLPAPSPSDASPAEPSGDDGRVLPGGVTPSGPPETSSRMFGSSSGGGLAAADVASVVADSVVAVGEGPPAVEAATAAAAPAAAAAAAALALECGDMSISETTVNADVDGVSPLGHRRARVSGTYTAAAVAAIAASAAGQGVRSSSKVSVGRVGADVGAG